MEVVQTYAQMWEKKEHDDDMMNMTESQWVLFRPICPLSLIPLSMP